MIWLRFADFDFAEHGLESQGAYPVWTRMENGGRLGNRGFLFDSGKHPRIRALAPILPWDGLQIDIVFRTSFPLAERRTLVFGAGSFELAVSDRRHRVELHVRTPDGWRHVTLDGPDLSAEERRLRVLVGSGASILMGFDGGIGARARTPVRAPMPLIKPEILIGGDPAISGVTEEEFDPGAERGAICLLAIDFGFDEKRDFVRRLTTAIDEADKGGAATVVADLADALGGIPLASHDSGKEKGEVDEPTDPFGLSHATWSGWSEYLGSEAGTEFWAALSSGSVSAEQIDSAARSVVKATSREDRDRLQELLTRMYAATSKNERFRDIVPEVDRLLTVLIEMLRNAPSGK